MSRVKLDGRVADKQTIKEEPPFTSHVHPKVIDSSPKLTGNLILLLIREGKIMDSENMCNTNILIMEGKMGAIGVGLDNGKGISEIDATNLVISPGLVDISATSHAFRGNLGAGSLADEIRIREATSRAVLAGVTSIVDTIYCDDRHSPVSAVAAYLQALQTTHVNCNLAVRVLFRLLYKPTSILEFDVSNNLSCSQLSIPESDRVLCEKGGSESIVLFGVLSACCGLGIIPTIGLDKITGTQMPKTNENPELRMASVAITIAKLADCPIILSPVRNVAVMHRNYRAQREYPHLFIYADFAVNAFVASRGWVNERHITGASCQRPTQLVDIYPRKGHLAMGADAELVLWSSNNRSRPVSTIIGGCIALQGGEDCGTQLHMKGLGMALETLDPPPEEEMIAKLKNTKLGTSGDVPLAGLPTVEIRPIANRYKLESPSSSFQTTGKKEIGDQSIRLNTKIWRSNLNSTCPY
ncbi:hypothetical protein Aperf_G00000066675 [Anoplocephala perfoliata]